MAFQNYGAWALVGQQLTSAAVSVVLLWAVSPWRPAFHFSRSDFRSLFTFGFNVVGSDFLGFLSRNMDNLLIGVFLGPVALGFYAVAYKILDTSQQLLLAAARRLVFPAFARLQHDMERIRRAYIRLSRASGAVTLPGYIGLALVAPEAIVVLFGQKWEPSATAAAVLFMIGPALTIQSFSGAIWNAVGHPEVSLRFRLITTVVNVTGFVIAVLVFQDIVAVAAAYTIRGYALMPLNMYWMRVYGGVPIRDQVWPLRGVFVATIVMAVAVIAVKVAMGDHARHLELLIVEVAVGVITFSIALFIVDRPLVKDAIAIFSLAVPGGERIARRLGTRVPRRRRAVRVPLDPPSTDAPEEA
jgi:PST family polysaccharide transporter